MYAAQLRRRPEYKDLQRAVEQVKKYRDMQHKELENMAKELENRNSKRSTASARKKLVEHQNKINYTNEIQRIRGYLTQLNPRFTSTIEALEKRKKNLMDLGGKIVDSIDD